MKIKPAILLLLLAAGCAGPQFHVLSAPPRQRVVLKSVNFEREIADRDWKSLVGVAADASGTAYILDASTHQVAVYGPQGQPVMKFGETGFWKKTFPRPGGIAVDGEERVFVSDTKEDCIQVFDRRGAFVARIGKKGSDAGQFSDPLGVAVDAARNLYVADQGNNRIQKFDERGVFSTQILPGPMQIEKINISRTDGPIKFLGLPMFKMLRGVATGIDGIVYALDEGTCVVHAYSPDGGYLFSFGGRGRRAGKFEKPAGIAVGALGIVCVSDEKKHNVQFFDPEGRFLTATGGKGSGRGQFKEPQGVGATPDGLVFVADKGNRRVQVFSLAVPSAVAPAARLEKPVRIAVFDFANNNPQARSRGYGETISDMFITAFARRPNFEVVERKQLRKVIDEIYLDQSGVVDAETTKRIGKVLGIDVALTGGVALFANAIEIDLRMLDIETGKVIIADSLRAAFEGQLREIVNGEVLKLENTYLVRFGPPAPPAGVMIEGGVRECSLSWQPSKEPDFREYRIYRAEAADGPFNLIGSTRKNTWVDKGLSDGTAYHYRVTAVDASGMESKYIPDLSGDTRGRPVIGDIPVTAKAEVKKSAFSWTEREEGVTGYMVYRSSSPEGPFSPVGETRTPRFSERGFGDGERYYYKIAKKYRNGLQSEPSSAFAVATKPRPGMPEEVTATEGLARKVVLLWGAPKERDIREWRVYRSESEDGEYRRIAAVKPGWFAGPGYTDSGLRDDTTYYYKVEAVDKDNLASPRSAPVKAATKPPPAVPRGLVAESGGARRVLLAWERNPEADIRAYEIHFTEKEGRGFRKLGETADISFAHTGLKDKTPYHYRIRAVDRDGLQSGFSETASATTKPRPGRPSGLAAQSGLPRSVRLAWLPGPERDIVRYVVSRRIAGGRAFTDVGTSRKPVYLDAGLDDGKTYQYAVRAVDADGLESDASERAEATTKPAPSRPEGLRADVSGGRIVLEWNANPEADIARYEIHRSGAWVILGGETKVGEAAETRFEDPTAQPGKSYTYRIYAVDADGLRSAKSAAIQAALAVPGGRGLKLPFN